MELPLFYNHLIKIDNKSLCFKSWYDRGIRYIKDIMSSDFKCIQIQELEGKLGIKINFLTYAGIRNNINKLLKTITNLNEDNKSVDISFPIIPCHLKHILKSKKGTFHIYTLFINNSEVPSCHKKWCDIFEIQNSEWEKIHGWVFETSDDTYLQWLQTRIVHRILGTNYLTYKMKLTSTELCSFCMKENETLLHLFWDCEYIKTLIQEVQNIVIVHDSNFYINKKSFILGYSKQKLSHYNVLCLEIKRYIFLCKTKNIKPSILGVKSSLKMTSMINATIENNKKKKTYWSLVDLFK